MVIGTVISTQYYLSTHHLTYTQFDTTTATNLQQKQYFFEYRRACVLGGVALDWALLLRINYTISVRNVHYLH